MKSKGIRKAGLSAIAFFVLDIILSGCTSLRSLVGGLPSTGRDPAEVLAEYVTKRGLPAAALLALGPEGVLVKELAGVRKAGSEQPVERDDAFHIGSDTKAMTALLCAMAVDEGRLAWNSSVAEVLGRNIAGNFAAVTLEQLLSHSSGMAGNPPASWKSFFEAWEEPVAQERERMAKDALAGRPASKPARAFIYSNFNYVVAGLMLERVYGESWEKLIGERIFMPLGMEGAGFGPPNTGSGDDAPWGHSPRPVPFGPYADNPPAIGPAGTVHLSLDDLAAWLRFILDGGRAADGTRLVSEESFRSLFVLRPGSGVYALGWGVVSGPAGETMYAHDGSNTMFYCSILILPDSGQAFAVLANRGDGPTAGRVAELREYLRKRQIGGG
jgi:CubicO group peptidase (beta-lactamase class C family)